MRFDPSSAFIDCPKCDSASHVERVKGASWFCNCCAHSFEVSLPETGTTRNSARGVNPKAALQFITAVALLALLPAMGNAQTDPRTLPRLDLSGVTAAGSFTYDWPDGAGGDLSYGGGALGVSEDGKLLYISCVQDRAGFAVLEIPSLGSRARVMRPCLGPASAEIAKVHPDPNAFRPMLGGILELNGRITVTGYISYDASGGTTASHWHGANLTSLSGPFGGTVSPGLTAGPMAVIPQEWRALLGGPALTSLYLRSIVSRSSYGFTASVFDPATVTANGFPMTMLVGCRHNDPGCNTYQNDGAGKDNYQGAELSGGFFIAPGTRTLVAIEREASGPACYGYSTTNQALHGQDHPGPDDARWCYSLSDPADKGPKGYPYKLVAKLYDLNDLADVKAGTKQPWTIRQYATVDMPGSSASEFVQSGAFNPVTGDYYLVRGTGGGVNTIHVYRGFPKSGAPVPPPPPPPNPVDCVGTWGAWTRIANSESACDATGSRTFTESRLFTVSRTPTNGGAACPASPETRTTAEACVPPVSQVTYTCWVTSSPASYADGDVRRYIRCDTNGPVASLPNGTTFTVTVPRK